WAGKGDGLLGFAKQSHDQRRQRTNSPHKPWRNRRKIPVFQSAAGGEYISIGHVAMTATKNIARRWWSSDLPVLRIPQPRFRIHGFCHTESRGIHYFSTGKE